MRCVAPFVLVTGSSSCDMNTTARRLLILPGGACLLFWWFVLHKHSLLSGTTPIARMAVVTFQCVVKADSALAQEQVCC